MSNAEAVVARGRAAVRGRAALSRRAAYGVAAAVIGLGLFASVTPSPLYQLYAERWHFSTVTLTLVYATYAFGVLVSLLLTGRVSDDVGRRPVLIAALVGLLGSTTLFALARSVAWLFAARGLQGIATGAALSAASAALLDLHPRRDPTAVSLTNAVASATGLGVGVLVSSALVQLGHAPRLLPFLVLGVLAAVTLAGAFLMPEPVAERRRFRLTFERPGVPPVVRRPFALAALAVLSSWSIGGLFFSLGPELGARLFHSTNAVVEAIGIAALTGSAAVSQLVFARIAPWRGASLGSVALALGTAVIVAGTGLTSAPLYVAGAVIGGVGFGLAFLGGLRALAAQIPAERRAAVMSAFYVAAYASLSVPAVLGGIVASHVALTTTFEWFGGVVIVLALVVAVEAWRTRPRVD